MEGVRGEKHKFHNTHFRGVLQRCMQRIIMIYKKSINLKCMSQWKKPEKNEMCERFRSEGSTRKTNTINYCTIWYTEHMAHWRDNTIMLMGGMSWTVRYHRVEPSCTLWVHASLLPGGVCFMAFPGLMSTCSLVARWGLFHDLPGLMSACSLVGRWGLFHDLPGLHEGT